MLYSNTDISIVSVKDRDTSAANAVPVISDFFQPGEKSALLFHSSITIFPSCKIPPKSALF